MDIVLLPVHLVQLTFPLYVGFCSENIIYFTR